MWAQSVPCFDEVAGLSQVLEACGMLGDREEMSRSKTGAALTPQRPTWVCLHCIVRARIVRSLLTPPIYKEDFLHQGSRRALDLALYCTVLSVSEDHDQGMGALARWSR